MSHLQNLLFAIQNDPDAGPWGPWAGKMSKAAAEESASKAKPKLSLRDAVFAAAESCDDPDIREWFRLLAKGDAPGVETREDTSWNLPPQPVKAEEPKANQEESGVSERDRAKEKARRYRAAKRMERFEADLAELAAQAGLTPKGEA